MISEKMSTYYLSDEELAVLLAGKGQKVFYGYKIDSIAQMTSAELYQILFCLSQKGIIRFQNEGIKIDEAFEFVLSAICRAEYALTFIHKENTVSQMIVYGGEPTIAVQPCGHKMLRIFKLSQYDVPKLLIDSGYSVTTFLNSDEKEDAINVIDCPKVVMDKINYFLNCEDAEPLQNTNAEFCMTCTNLLAGKRIGLLLLITYGAKDYLIVKKNEEIKSFVYSEKMLSKIINEWNA